MMDYKELIKKLRSDYYGGPKFEEIAANAIETLLEERDAAVGMLVREWRGPQKENKHEAD